MTRLHPYGDHAVLVTDLTGTPTVLAGQLARVLPHASTRSGLDTVLVEFSIPSSDHVQQVSEALQSAPETPATARQPRLHEVPVRYDGEDLSEAAAACGLDIPGLVEAHTSTVWTVAMLGFAPGFPYLTADQDSPAGPLPRRSTPRTRVPAGSVALAAGMSAIYPEAMPGGWHLLGSTDIILFDVRREDSPALLEPGDHVRFVAVAS